MTDCTDIHLSQMICLETFKIFIFPLLKFKFYQAPKVPSIGTVNDLSIQSFIGFY